MSAEKILSIKEKLEELERLLNELNVKFLVPLECKQILHQLPDHSFPLIICDYELGIWVFVKNKNEIDEKIKTLKKLKSS
jgi:hypothetical protein